MSKHLLKKIDTYFVKENSVSVDFFYLIAIIFILFGLVTSSFPKFIFDFWAILTSPSGLVTDYFEVGGISATFVNAGILMLINAYFVSRNTRWITGPIVAALFTVMGFAFFGKNLYNAIPITLGIGLYSRYQNLPFKSVLLTALFATALGPVVSLVSFGQGLPLYIGMPLGWALGIGIGFIISPVASSFLRFHQGYNLYNIGFTGGVIAMILVSIMRAFHLSVETVTVNSSVDLPLINSFFILFCICLLIMGFIANNFSFTGYQSMSHKSGRLITDVVVEYSAGLALINIGVMGLLSIAYVQVVGGNINGPVIGGILTVMGFAAFGKHPRNTFPIVLGIFLVQTFMSSDSPSSTASLLAALFGTTLAPIAGQYGVLAGIIAGGLHATVVQNVGDVHAGLNLYNNGFAGGFVAATLVPLLDSFEERKQRLNVGNKESKVNK